MDNGEPIHHAVHLIHLKLIIAMRIQEAKQIPMVQLLQQLGYEAKHTRKGGNEWWYCSPFRSETQPSFKITIDKNTWYDFGMGEGGTIIDFLMHFQNTDVSGVLAYLDKDFVSRKFSPSSSNTFTSVSPPPSLGEKSERKITKFQSLQHPALLQYLEERSIITTFALNHSRKGFQKEQPYFGELHYTHNGKAFFTIGLCNQSGGYELRCKGFKGCIGMKDISIIQTSAAPILRVYEGMMDWLSLLSIVEKGDAPIEGTALILNSTALIDKAISFIQSESFEKVLVYLDNDESGQKAFHQLQLNCSHLSIEDKRNNYKHHNDLNDFLIEQIKKDSPSM